MVKFILNDYEVTMRELKVILMSFRIPFALLHIHFTLPTHTTYVEAQGT
jgi:hypothetical protein